MSDISRNPAIMSGMYCIRGTRISVRWVKGRHKAGDSMKHLAWDYHLPVRLIKAAINFRASKGRP